MSSARFNPPELRKPAGSPRPKGRENSKDTLCRNVTIYGHCRWEDSGCVFSHDPNKTLNAQVDSKKSLNVDSPAFTPSTLAVTGKTSTISSQAASAAPFTPRFGGTTTPNPPADAEPAVFNPATIKEFTPQNYDLSHGLLANGAAPDAQTSYDPFSMQTMNQAMPSAPYNPYLEENNIPTNAAGYFQTQAAFSSPAQPLQYHLYAPVGAHRQDLLAYQRHTHDFFMPNDLREDLQKKSEAARQVMPNSQLPVVEHYHTLVPLDISHHRSATVFGFPSWVYKAVSSKNGLTYVLRRIEGFRLSNANAVQSAKNWKRVDNAGVVSVIDAFTTRAFGDSSLIFVYNYYPLSKTLVETHFTNTNRYGNRIATAVVSEQILWGYIVQIANAIKAIHAANLAARCMDLSKVLVTDKNRIRLNACSILDVVQFEADRPIVELQQEDFILFGKLILAIATNNLNLASSNTPLKGSLESLKRNYSVEFRDTVEWLLTPAIAPETKDLNEFIRGISGQIMTSYDNSLHANDTAIGTLSQELENGRLFRLIAKLGTINERPEYEGDVKWSEVGERYILKLFRDYVFHQVNADGKPVVDLAHILECMNKLDAGSSQQIKLVSRDDQDCMIVSYKELKKQVDLAFGELLKPSGKRY
ncbi:PAB-dependent poly(A)-specific ribonuclease subunit 3 [Cadophora gregata]|uniref:PAB-dependent poly(A)-specific ribonuclease subunit 3 n=1 Tax=Cadophora gregata TaxID=51156 RepID=UPI0026DC83A8|nr:PAB-dependent poly(A)-specific ribonuclease subunit 3 [Cadophora gregata]KAK0110148.1 PAB-dependent poly(A)-specific ribonuclease subunit 3 [Cadophora gregata]KAK0110236.1 PAB-dependent poly(A)-specific ribonuclease subunit 3 [Cadophora gregata f. sp. sojae]